MLPLNLIQCFRLEINKDCLTDKSGIFLNKFLKNDLPNGLNYDNNNQFYVELSYAIEMN